MGKLLSILLLAIAMPAFGRQRIQGWCEQGNRTITVNSVVTSTATPVQRSFPSCTVTVFVASSGAVASIYADNVGTPKSNAFVAATSGYWFFYVDNGTYNVQFSGGGISPTFSFGAQTAWDSRDAGLFDIGQYGGIPDGVTDNTAAFNAAVADMAEGGTLVLSGGPPGVGNTGVYLVTPITITKNIYVQCSSPLVVIQSKTANPDGSDQIPSGGALVFSGITKGGIRGCKIDGNYPTTSGVVGVLVKNSSNFIAEGNTFQNLGGTGLSIATSNYVRVLNNNFSEIYKSGVRVEFPNPNSSNYIWVTGNYLVDNNISATGGYAAIQTYGSMQLSPKPITNVLVSGNNIVNAGTVGIGLDRCDYCEASSNRVTTAGGECIAFTGSHVLIANNTVSGGVASAGMMLFGVQAVPLDHNVFIGNIAFNNVAQGIAIVFGEDGTAIDNLTVYNNVGWTTNATQEYGIQSYVSPGVTSYSWTNVVIEHNNFAGNSLGAANLLSAAGSFVYQDNVGQTAMDNADSQLTVPGVVPIVDQFGLLGSNFWNLFVNPSNNYFGIGMPSMDALYGNSSPPAAQYPMDLLGAARITGQGLSTYPLRINNRGETGTGYSGADFVNDTGAVRMGGIGARPDYSVAIANSQPNVPSSGASLGSTSLSNIAFYAGGTEGAGTLVGRISKRGLVPPVTTFSSLSSSTNEALTIWCSDCVVNTTPPYTCAGSGTGSWAFLNKTSGVWKCPY